MALKKFFGGGGGIEKAPQDLDIDDLIVLERYAEAEGRLRARVKDSPNDLHAHLRLADVYYATAQSEKAAEQFAFVAAEYADDGFHDKGLALLAKALKLLPADKSLLDQVSEIEERKTLDRRRSLAIEGFLQAAAQAGTAQSSNALIEAQQLWLHLCDTQLVKNLVGDQLRRLFSAADLRHVAARTILVAEGDSLEQLFLIGKGAIEVVGETAQGLTTLRSFLPGDVVGEGALFERKAWPGTYRTTQVSTLIVLDRTRLEVALTGNPDPRALIEGLRSQRHDREVESVMNSYRAAGTAG